MPDITVPEEAYVDGTKAISHLAENTEDEPCEAEVLATSVIDAAAPHIYKAAYEAGFEACQVVAEKNMASVFEPSRGGTWSVPTRWRQHPHSEQW